MDYDMEMHIPGQIETLLRQRNNSDIKGFDDTLQAVKILMKDHEKFLKGLNDDLKKRDERIQTLYKDTKEAVIKTLNERPLEEGLSIAHQILSHAGENYKEYHDEYMTDAITTCVSYHSKDV